ncbi:unnamed protein product [Meganyctiphanes norvegica]|uniref:Uncharacterized protein n=1 Tax=Meganyctiphanes norvegica TaxID=48144 RepID=A0AAV2PU53_MEGNR
MNSSHIFLHIIISLMIISGCSCITCYKCSNRAQLDDYDPDCGMPDYSGATVQCDDCTSCRTEIYLDGDVYRVGWKGSVEDECIYYSDSTECYCTTDLCNLDLCDQC